MKELEFLKIIKHSLSKNTNIGDDCAYLEELGIVVTHDSLVEGIHFCSKNTTPYQLGYRAIVVNLSDIFASGALPKYFTISLSLPKTIDSEFVKEFYRACDDLSKEYDFEVIGGDITGSDKIFVSVCAIGVTKGRKIASRSHAKVGDYVVATGNHGSSAAGLWALENEKGEMIEEDTRARRQEGKKISRNFALQNYDNSSLISSLISQHLMPIPQKDFSNEIATKVDRDYAMMDTSDGLMDALFKVAQASKVSIKVDFDKIPYDKTVEKVALLADVDYKDWIFYGGEDFQLVACIDEENLRKISADYTIIGRVAAKKEDCFVEVDFGDKIQKITDLEKTFNHFGGK